MLQLPELKKEIESLPKHEYINLRRWFSEKDWEIWDKQIEEDSNSGKLDFLSREALQENRRIGKSAALLCQLFNRDVRLV